MTVRRLRRVGDGRAGFDQRLRRLGEVEGTVAFLFDLVAHLGGVGEIVAPDAEYAVHGRAFGEALDGQRYGRGRRPELCLGHEAFSTRMSIGRAQIFYHFGARGEAVSTREQGEASASRGRDSRRPAATSCHKAVRIPLQSHPIEFGDKARRGREARRVASRGGIISYSAWKTPSLQKAASAWRK